MAGLPFSPLPLPPLLSSSQSCAEDGVAWGWGTHSTEHHAEDPGSERPQAPTSLRDSVLSSLKFRSILVARQLPSALSSSDAVK